MSHAMIEESPEESLPQSATSEENTRSFARLLVLLSIVYFTPGIERSGAGFPFSYLEYGLYDNVILFDVESLFLNVLVATILIFFFRSFGKRQAQWVRSFLDTALIITLISFTLAHIFPVIGFALAYLISPLAVALIAPSHLYSAAIAGIYSLWPGGLVSHTYLSKILVIVVTSCAMSVRGILAIRKGSNGKVLEDRRLLLTMAMLIILCGVDSWRYRTKYYVAEIPNIFKPENYPSSSGEPKAYMAARLVKTSLAQAHQQGPSVQSEWCRSVSPISRAACFSLAAYRLSDPTFCDYITSDVDRNDCLRNMQSHPILRGVATRDQNSEITALPYPAISPVAGLKTIKGLQWKYKTKGQISRTPIPLQDLVVFGSKDQHLYALDMKSGRLKWKVPILVNASSGTVANDIVYVGDGHKSVLGFDIHNGQKVWEFLANWPVVGAPAVYKNSLIFATEDAAIYRVDIQARVPKWHHQLDIQTFSHLTGGFTLIPELEIGVVGSSMGPVLAIDLDDGTLKWRSDFAHYALVASTANADAVIASGDKVLRALNTKDGSTLWETALEDRAIIRYPVVSDGSVYIAQGSSIESYNAETGQKRWTHRISDTINSPVTVTQDVLYVGGWSHMWALEKGTGAELWRFPTDGNINSAAIATSESLLFGSEDGYFYSLR